MLSHHMGVVFPVSREPVPGPSAYQRNYNLFSRWSTPEEMFRLNQTLKERKLHMETLCIVQLLFFSWLLFICCVFFSSLFFKRVKILCLCKCHPGGFDIITVLPPSAKQTILQLLFCVRCRKKKEKYELQKSRVEDRCLRVRALVCITACVYVCNKGNETKRK